MSIIKDLSKKAFVTVREHSPEILLVAGIGGVVTATVLACKATTKASGIIDEFKTDKEQIEECKKRIEEGEDINYTEEDAQKDTVVAYGKLARGMAKAYLPSILVGAASIAAIFTSNGILKSRATAATTACTAVSTAFNKYREKIKDKYGEDVDAWARYNVEKEKVKVKEVAEDGSEKTVKKEVNTVKNDFTIDETTRIFDELNPLWSKDAEENKARILQHQRYIQQKVNTQPTCLNEVLDGFGFKRTRYGQTHGWKKGDVVDFGMLRIVDGAIDKSSSNFINGDERSIILNFNCRPEEILDDIELF